jgi:hypothetical protein
MVASLNVNGALRREVRPAEARNAARKTVVNGR